MVATTRIELARVLDVALGAAEGLSLEGLEGVHFVARSRPLGR
jgi:hypothetical protein